MKLIRKFARALTNGPIEMFCLLLMFLVAMAAVLDPPVKWEGLMLGIEAWRIQACLLMGGPAIVSLILVWGCYYLAGEF